MNTKHTPGPWVSYAAPESSYANYKVHLGRTYILVDGEADARLIAAAPELLAACELFTAAAHDAVHALNDAGLACPSSIAFAAEQARAAIAKVEGV